MTSKIAAYEWQLDGTTHVAYQAADTHIHELVIGREEAWRDADITRVAGGAEGERAILTGYAWPAGRTQQVAYTSPLSKDGHIHELVMLHDHPWSYADLMAQPSGAPAADGSALLGTALEAGGTKHVFYTGRDGHLHELSTGVIGMWLHTDLMRVTGAPLPEEALLTAYAWQARHSRQVAYIGGDGHIHELTAPAGGTWSHQDVTDLAEAPPADGLALVGFAWETGGTKQIVYTGNGGHLYELVAGAKSESIWRFADITRLTSAPLLATAALAGFAWETGGTKQVVYVGADRHVHEVMREKHGAWTHTDLTTLLGIPEGRSEVIAGHEWSAQFAKHVIYLDTQENPHIHSLLLVHGSDWRHADLTELTGAPALA
jgi:hypothetical protein